MWGPRAGVLLGGLHCQLWGWDVAELVVGEVQGLFDQVVEVSVPQGMERNNGHSELLGLLANGNPMEVE